MNQQDEQSSVQQALDFLKQWQEKDKDICDCDQRCSKCGKKKAAPYQPYPSIGGYYCGSCRRWVGTYEYHYCMGPVWTSAGISSGGL